MRIIQYIGFTLCTALFMACSDEVINTEPETPEENELGLVQFSTASEALTRAATYMPGGVRFSAVMHHTQTSGFYNFENPTQAYLVVDNMGGGNSWYYKSTYATPEHYDEYNNDDDATIFYWQNRQNHAFIGYINDYNAALRTANGTKKAGEPDYIPELMYGDNLYKTTPVKDKDGNVLYYLKYKEVNLKNTKTGEDTYLWNSMNDQPDPLIATNEKAPQSSSAELNRVPLVFKHQLSQVQVNIKPHESIAMTKEQIKKVELLGVSEKALIYPYFITYNAEEGDENYGKPVIADKATTGLLAHKAQAVAVNLNAIDPEVLEDNQWGTSFNMFMESDANTTAGFLRTFNCITFGTLEAIRITWAEPEEEGNVEHVVTFVVTNNPADTNDYKNLASGKRYIFNMELRRGTLAVIHAVIDDWIPYETEYPAQGTISK